MASKTKKGTPAPTSKELVVRKKPKGNPLSPGKTYDGRPNRAEKKIANKAASKAAHQDVKTKREEVKQLGAAAATPYIVKLIGNPVEWTEVLSEALFALISTGHSMEDISKMEGMPSLYRMLRWLGEDAHPFKELYARAKEALVPMYEELAQRIAMTTNSHELKTFKQVVTKDGDVVDVEETRIVDNVERSKLAVATMQWTLGHLKPRKHGRSPDQTAGTANEQLKGLFDALKAGPVDG